MQTILKELKIKADVVNVENNGTMSKYYLRLHSGTKVSKIENCATEIALGLKSYGKPIIRVITEKGLVVVELLTNPISFVGFNEVANLKENDLSVPLVLGRTHDGNDLIIDLAELPHLLIAGTTGSGKSVLLHSILSGIISSGKPIKLVLIDPKKVELSYYSNIKHLPDRSIITDPTDALKVLSDLVITMNARFEDMKKKHVNNISELKNPPERIVVMIDEFSDLMHSSGKEFPKQLCMLAQKSRACGIHIIIATQRPSADIVTGIIKANFPSRISCRVSSLTDSRVILGCSGAEKLLGKGDALLSSVGYDMIRFQGAYISPDEIRELCDINKCGRIVRVINFLKGE